MNPRTVLLGLLLALLLALTGAAAFAWLPGRSSAGGSAAPGDATPMTGVRDPRATTRPGQRATPSSPGERSAVPLVDLSTAAVTDDELVEVAIVRADTRQPVPAATVWWWPRPAEGDEGFSDWLRASAVDDHLQAATRLQSDRFGLVRVPDVAQGFTVAAALDDLWGHATIVPERREAAVVLLAPDADLRVQVVDQDGAPVADAPVVLRERRLQSTLDHQSARSGRDGVAVLRHAGRLTGAGTDAGLSVALQGLFDPPVEQRLANAPPGEVLRLVLGPAGVCEVAVVDAGDQPVGGPIEACLRFADDGARTPDDAVGETLGSRTGGAVVFEHVALGRTLAVAVTNADTHERLEATGRGPAAAGERVRLRVRADASAAILRGRLIDAQGAPVGDLAVRARIEAADGRPCQGPWSLWTAPDGRFAFGIRPQEEPRDGLQFAIARRSPTGAESAAARRPLPRDLGPGPQDLGDFVLAEVPVAARGVVVDADGNPVAAATVTATIEGPRGEDGAAVPKDVLAPVRSDSRGRFEVRGENRADPIALAAAKEGLCGEPVVVRAPAQDVRLVLGAAGAITGTVLLDASLQESTVLVQASAPESARAAAGAPGASAVVGRDGAFALRGLLPGAYSVRVVHAATAAELARVDSVRVRAGAPVREGRLDPLDLRAAWRLLSLEVCDDAGLPVPHARAFSRPDGEAAARWQFGAPGHGRPELLSDGRPLDVAIAASGFLRLELERVTCSQRVVLHRAVRLRLELAGAELLAAPGVRLGAEVLPVRPGRFSGAVEPCVAWFDGNGVLACELPFAGDLRVELFVAATDPGTPARSYLHESAPRVLAAAQQAAEQTFRIGLDRDRLAAAIRALQQDR
jgi:hypothetical protein